MENDWSSGRNHRAGEGLRTEIGNRREKRGLPHDREARNALHLEDTNRPEPGGHVLSLCIQSLFAREELGRERWKTVLRAGAGSRLRPKNFRLRRRREAFSTMEKGREKCRCRFGALLYAYSRTSGSSFGWGAAGGEQRSDKFRVLDSVVGSGMRSWRRTGNAVRGSEAKADLPGIGAKRVGRQASSAT